MMGTILGSLRASCFGLIERQVGRGIRRYQHFIGGELAIEALIFAAYESAASRCAVEPISSAAVKTSP